jgi:hypothetical protein
MKARLFRGFGAEKRCILAQNQLKAGWNSPVLLADQLTCQLCEFGIPNGGSWSLR